MSGESRAWNAILDAWNANANSWAATVCDQDPADVTDLAWNAICLPWNQVTESWAGEEDAAATGVAHYPHRRYPLRISYGRELYLAYTPAEERKILTALWAREADTPQKPKKLVIRLGKGEEAEEQEESLAAPDMADREAMLVAWAAEQEDEESIMMILGMAL